MAPAPIAPAPAAVVAVQPARGEPIAVSNATSVTNTNNATLANEQSAGDGWAVKEQGWGVEPAARKEALARIAASPVRVLVQAGQSFEECSGLGGTHVYFTVPSSWGEKPFEAAVLGGHGVPLQGVFPRGHLYVAGVRVGQRYQHPKGSGWCLDGMGASDAAIIAVVPVRNAAEGLRLLQRMP